MFHILGRVAVKYKNRQVDFKIIGTTMVPWSPIARTFTFLHLITFPYKVHFTSSNSLEVLQPLSVTLQESDDNSNKINSNEGRSLSLSPFAYLKRNDSILKRSLSKSYIIFT